MAYRTQSLPSGACPRCLQPLTEVNPYGAALRNCVACGGIWLGLETSQMVMDGANTELRALAFSLAARNIERQMGMPETTLQCTVCAAELRPIDVPSAAVRIDACSLHGTWFDAWELSKVIRAVQRGRSAGVGGAGVLLDASANTADRSPPMAMQQQALVAAPARAAAHDLDENAFASPLRNFMLNVASFLRIVQAVSLCSVASAACGCPDCVAEFQRSARGD